MRYNQSFKIFVAAILVTIGVGCLPYYGGVEAAQEGRDVVRENKTLSGTVGFINSEFISIIDNSDAEAGVEHETLMYLDKDAQVIRKDNLNEIKAGDTVEIQYEKTTETLRDKKTLKDVRKSKQVIKGVKFLRESSVKGKDSTLTSGKK